MSISEIKGDQYTEAKEALAAALLTRVYREMSGEREHGEFVLGEKPSKRFSTGFLMPMRDVHGNENLTENLRISVHGMDLQTHKDMPGVIEIGAAYSIYIRVLPTWDDLCDTRYDMAPRFMLRPDLKSTIDNQVAQELVVAWNEIKSKPVTQRVSKRALREIIFREVRVRMGLPELGISMPEGEEEEEVIEGEEESASLPYNVSGGDIPDDLVTSIAPPQKWKRFATDQAIRVKIGSDTSQEHLDTVAGEFSENLRRSILNQIDAWLETEEGLSSVYRSVRVLPSDIINRKAWENFLARTRGTAPEIDSLIPPGIGDVRVLITRHTDFGKPSVHNFRIVLENYATTLNNIASKICEACIHQVEVVVSLPEALHHRLRLERIKPTYRFRHFFNYAALGINCGVSETKEDVVRLRTTWIPTYQQPRMEARSIPGLNTGFDFLANPTHDLSFLQLVPNEYSKWVEVQIAIDPAGHLSNPAHVAAERAVFNADIASYRREICQIERGIKLLQASRAEWVRNSACLQAAPYRAWLYLNTTMADAWGKNAMWHLFQLTFILSHIPAIVSRMKEFESFYDQDQDENTATLLYYSTGGGKSEAFYGLLIYNLFLDRLRGKNIGVTALIRYPLRLLTIQQAQRLFKLLAKAEMVKLKNSIGGDEFVIGFWVGSGNTPNRNSDPELKGVKKSVGEADPAPSDEDYNNYRLANQSYNKVQTCPHCEGATGLRRGNDENRKVLIVCRNGKCQWNVAHGGFHPLPFLITDDDIYGYAPAVVLGTIDKLALIGQHDSTINKIAGMLGLARFRDASGRLLMPRRGKALDGASASTAIAPAYKDGAEIFHDPFPSLLIQDEAHLLEESLGTFAGLFETSFDQLLEGLAPILGDRVARRPDGKPRLPKVIAATATISSPERQMETLYQRRAVRFPHPGTSLYESFYSIPKAPQSLARDAILPDSDPRKPEIVSPLMRIYVSLVTNGRVYAVATATTLSTYHAVVCRFWRMANKSDSALVMELISSLPENPLRPFWRDALLALDSNELHSLLDLFRIALVYVNSKRGGDQVIEAIAEESARGHRQLGEPFRQLRTELISGGVDIAAIQRVMALAQESVVGDDLDGALREIVATSAISHGVDEAKFNAMFFVGAPNDISELIQASSRVGRTHVGFSMLLPTPHSRRDRYIVEVHDIFNRFLELMISPAAIERWAANAIRRVMPSIFQLWLNGVKEQELFAMAEDKAETHALDMLKAVRDLMTAMGPRFIAELTDFAKRAISTQGRGVEGLGRPGSSIYYDGLVDQMVREICNDIAVRTGVSDTLSDYWNTSAVQRRPMTSLRDIDEVGMIVPGAYIPGSGFRRPSVENAILIATKVVRSQATDSSDVDCE